jgi:SAM-dependent methyltransferase
VSRGPQTDSDGRSAEPQREDEPAASMRRAMHLEGDGRSAELLPSICCPSCHGKLDRGDAQLTCRACRQTFPIFGGRIPNFLGGDSASAKAILAWPDHIWSIVDPALTSLASGKSISSADAALLGEHGIVDANGKPVPFALELVYHFGEYRRQIAGDGFPDRMLDRGLFRREAQILDVGCGAGQSLRVLGIHRPALRVGVDVDLDSLALGCRIAEEENEDIQLMRGTAHALPFRDESFSHVVTRVTLNYLRQREALHEMIRVLRPGGFFYCRLEGFGHELRLLRNARSARRVACCVRDTLYGTVHDFTGWQPPAWRRFGPGRMFGTARRLTTELAKLGTEVLDTHVWTRELGFPVSVSVLARKA